MFLLYVLFDASSVSLDIVADWAGGGVLYFVDLVSLLQALVGIVGTLDGNRASSAFLGCVIAFHAFNFDMIDQDLFDLPYLDLDLAQILELLEAEITISQNQIFEFTHVV